MAPYISTYANIINNNFSIICWDREEKEETYYDSDVYAYHSKKYHPTGLTKICDFIKYRRFIKGILKENDYDVIILLQTWCAILLNDVLVKHYKGRYIIDIRDYTYEKIPLIKLIERKVFKFAGMCVVSSEGYKTFLPSRQYYVTHNIRALETEIVNEIRNREKKREVLNIAFIGFVLYQEQSKRLLLALKNDNRFLISFIGTRALELQSFCEQNNIKNVRLVDTFEAKDILSYYRDVDIVNNLYGNNTPTLDYALSNKLYFAAELNMPILVCPDTYMEKVASKYGIGITVKEYDNNLGDYIWDKYQKIDWDKLRSLSSDFLSKAREEQEVYLTKVNEMVN